MTTLFGCSVLSLSDLKNNFASIFQLQHRCSQFVFWTTKQSSHFFVFLTLETLIKQQKHSSHFRTRTSTWMFSISTKGSHPSIGTELWFSTLNSNDHTFRCTCGGRGGGAPGAQPRGAARRRRGRGCIYVARVHSIHATTCVYCMQRLSACCANAVCLGRPRGRGTCICTALCGTWRGACARSAGMFATASMRSFATTWSR